MSGECGCLHHVKEYLPTSDYHLPSLLGQFIYASRNAIELPRTGCTQFREWNATVDGYDVS